MAEFDDDVSIDNAEENVEIVEEGDGIDYVEADGDIEVMEEEEIDETADANDDNNMDFEQDRPYFAFSLHEDAVYCIAVHPIHRHVVLTGKYCCQMHNCKFHFQ